MTHMWYLLHMVYKGYAYRTHICNTYNTQVLDICYINILHMVQKSKMGLNHSQNLIVSTSVSNLSVVRFQFHFLPSAFLKIPMDSLWIFCSRINEAPPSALPGSKFFPPPRRFFFGFSLLLLLAAS